MSNKKDSDKNQLPSSIPKTSFVTQIGKEKKVHLDMFCCGECKTVPVINSKNGISFEIECKECKKLPKKLSIESFLHEMKYEKNNPECNKINKHGPKKTEIYCGDCNKWFCDDCLKEHNNLKNKDHVLFTSDGLIMNSACHFQCPAGDKVSYYSPKTGMQGCSNCASQNFKKYPDFINIEKLADLTESTKKIDEFASKLEEKNKKFEGFIVELEEKVKQLRDFLNLIKKEDYQLCYIYKSFVALCEHTKILNFNSRLNIRSINYDSILEFKEKEIRNAIEGLNYIQRKHYGKTTELSFFEAEYEVKPSKKGENKADKAYKMKIFGDKFKGLNDANCIMFLDNQMVKFTKTFEKEGKHKVTVVVKPDQTLKETDNMFAECSSLNSINMSHLDTSNVTSMANMFLKCTDLKQANLTNFSTINVKDMNQMFSYCSSLEILDLESFKTPKVTDMKGLFSCCKELSYLNIPNFDTSAVKNMNLMFAYCSSLNSLNLESFKTESVENIGYMFIGDGFLSDLKFPGFSAKSVKERGCVVTGCESLSQDWKTKLEKGK